MVKGRLGVECCGERLGGALKRETCQGPGQTVMGWGTISSFKLPAHRPVSSAGALSLTASPVPGQPKAFPCAALSCSVLSMCRCVPVSHVSLYGSHLLSPCVLTTT